MQDIRVRIAIAALALVLVIGSAVAIFKARQPVNVVITGAVDTTPSGDTGAPPTSTADLGDMGDVTRKHKSHTFDEGPAPGAADVPQAPVGTGSAAEAPIAIDVAGAVKNPGVWTIPPGARVQDAIRAAGGAKPDADLDAVNLAERLTDGEKVYLPHKSEHVSAAPPGNSIGPPTPGVQATGGVEDSGGHSSSSGRSDKLTDPSQGRIDINSAGLDQLQRLPGVGPAMAARILAYRQQNGGFKSPQELMDVGGIGEKRMARLAPFVVVH
ncbi:MAG: helix-hairpin-helix domain-containing protein [Capsulimonadaceae bacterium]